MLCPYCKDKDNFSTSSDPRFSIEEDDVVETLHRCFGCKKEFVLLYRTYMSVKKEDSTRFCYEED